MSSKESGVIAFAGLTAIVVVALDQMTKVVARSAVSGSGSDEILGGLITIVDVRNSGVAFGQLSGGGIIVPVFVGLALVALLWYFLCHLQTPLIWLATGLVVGGAVGNIVGGPKDVDVPYVWTRGNHDSMATQNDLKRNGAIVLDDTSYNQAGVSYWGIGDPTFSPKADKSVVRLGEKQYKQKWSKEVLVPALGKLPAQPDVLVVHDPHMADGLTNKPKLTISGHTHKFKSTVGRNADGTPWAVVTNGSTGGAGLRVLDTGKERPMQACIIWLDKETKEPQFLDLFSFRPLVDDTYSAERVSLLPPS